MWALLATVALGVGFGAARALQVGSAWRAQDTPEPPRLVRAAFALALTWPLVGLIVATSTGVDWISSWIRWGGCGIAAVVCAGTALVPGRAEARALGGLTFALAVGFSLLAEREYVEALCHAALAHRDPFDPAVGWVGGMREIAAAVEPRERYGPWLGLLPWLAVSPGAATWRCALPRLVAGLGVLTSGALAATANLVHGSTRPPGGRATRPRPPRSSRRRSSPGRAESCLGPQPRCERSGACEAHGRADTCISAS